jgi:hypothetical protein
MKHTSLRSLARLGLLVCTAVGAVLGGCGGVGSGGTGSFASGPITGFGSVIVNDVRFDDTLATVEDADGTHRTRDDLRLGMTVEIDASFITTNASGSAATASRIHYESDLLGPVDTVDGAGGNFTVLGQRVAVDATTVFDDSLTTGLNGLAGRTVAVYAVYDAAATRYRATRVEPAATAAAPRLRGVLSQVNAAAQTLVIGATSYGYAGAASVPAGLAAGQVVRLRLAAVALPVLHWVVQSFGAAPRPLPDGDGAKVKGLITAFASATSFSVDGRPVDASAAAVPGGLALGVRVEVEGSVRGGVLQATRVTIKSDQEEHDRGFELHGTIASASAAQQTFVLRGLTVSTARSDLVLLGGTAADLVAGRQVQVQGQLSADRTRIDATQIKFD